MKIIISIILVMSVLFSLSACGKNNLKGAGTQNTQGNQAAETSPNNTEGHTIQDSQSDQEDLQDKNIVITPDIQNVKFYFTNPSNNPKDVNKTYLEQKSSKYEDYADTNITEKTVTFLGKEFQNIPYSISSKNPYKDRDEDIFRNNDITVSTKKSGEITSFYTFTPLNIFSSENKNSVELAKKYLNAILPDFKYDEVNERKLKYSGTTWYSFRKTINGIPISESVTIGLNSKGELLFFSSYDVGKYDNIEITAIDKDVYLQKADEILKATYGDTLKDYSISDDGPFYEIYNNNKLELSIPISIDIVTSQGNAYSFGEYVVLELN